MNAIAEKWQTALAVSLALAGLSAMFACHSYHIDATIENRTGGPVKLMEVDYPSASFGADSLAANGVLHYSFQTRGSGQISVQYTRADGHQVQAKGPELYERQEGRLEISLLPEGKIEFTPSLGPRH